MAPQAPERTLSMTPKTPAYSAEMAPNMGKAKLPQQQAQQQNQHAQQKDNTQQAATQKQDKDES